MRELIAPPTGSTPGTGRPVPFHVRRVGAVAAVVLGLTALSGTAATGPAAAADTGSASAQEIRPDGSYAAQPDGGYGSGGQGRGGGHGEGQGNGHGHGKGHGRTVDYVAFGDSYASGIGGGPVLDACGRTAEGYPALLDALPRVELDGFQACSGATALTTDPAPPAGPVDLPEQINAAVTAGQLNRQTDLVTVTISGNDVQFGSIVAACAGTVLPDTCAPALAAAQAFAATAVVPQLQDSFAAVRQAAPRAELVVAGYPHLFEGTAPGILSVEAQSLFNAGTDALNALVAEQVGDGTFVDVTEAFAGHGIGSPDPWILAAGPAALHPTAAGYSEGYFAAITDAVELLDPDRHGRGGCRGGRG